MNKKICFLVFLFGAIIILSNFVIAEGVLVLESERNAVAAPIKTNIYYSIDAPSCDSFVNSKLILEIQGQAKFESNNAQRLEIDLGEIKKDVKQQTIGLIIEEKFQGKDEDYIEIKATLEYNEHNCILRSVNDKKEIEHSSFTLFSYWKDTECTNKLSLCEGKIDEYTLETNRLKATISNLEQEKQQLQEGLNMKDIQAAATGPPSSGESKKVSRIWVLLALVVGILIGLRISKNKGNKTGGTPSPHRNL